MVTVVESAATVLRSAGRFALAEGARLQSGDVIEVGQAGLLQIGFADESRLSLGPHSRFYLAVLAGPGAAARAGKSAGSEFYLQHGWSKLALGQAAAPTRLTTPLFALAASDAIAVLQVQESEAGLFVEKGELRVSDGFGKAALAAAVNVRAGQFYTHRADQRGALQARPSASFIAAMPRQYQDNLPERLPKFKDREVAPRRLGDLAYADVERWLKGPPELRMSLMPRLRARARDPAFREALIKNLSFHPEWDRVLFPEKYRKPPSTEPTRKVP